MATSFWKHLVSPDLSPSTITLREWDGHPSHPLGMYCNFPVIVVGKTIYIDIEVINAPLDYNIIFGHRYTYEISNVPSSIHHKPARGIPQHEPEAATRARGDNKGP